MYQEARKKDGSLTHSAQCQMTFGRKDENCPRCQELLNGAAPRAGWQKKYFEQKKRTEEMELAAIRSHDCKKSNCSVVCTFGDW